MSYKMESNFVSVEIVSGEGTGLGTKETFTGKLTARAVGMRVKKETCGGDRWAYANITNKDGSIMRWVLTKSSGFVPMERVDHGYHN